MSGIDSLNLQLQCIVVLQWKATSTELKNNLHIFYQTVKYRQQEVRT